MSAIFARSPPLVWRRGLTRGRFLMTEVLDSGSTQAHQHHPGTKGITSRSTWSVASPGGAWASGYNHHHHHPPPARGIHFPANRQYRQISCGGVAAVTPGTQMSARFLRQRRSSSDAIRRRDMRTDDVSHQNIPAWTGRLWCELFIVCGAASVGYCLVMEGKELTTPPPSQQKER